MARKELGCIFHLPSCCSWCVCVCVYVHVCTCLGVNVYVCAHVCVCGGGGLLCVGVCVRMCMFAEKLGILQSEIDRMGCLADLARNGLSDVTNHSIHHDSDRDEAAEDEDRPEQQSVSGQHIAEFTGVSYFGLTNPLCRPLLGILFRTLPPCASFSCWPAPRTQLPVIVYKPSVSASSLAPFSSLSLALYLYICTRMSSPVHTTSRTLRTVRVLVRAANKRFGSVPPSTNCSCRAQLSTISCLKCLLFTVNFAYNDTRLDIRKMSFFVNCPYTRSLYICITVRWDFALGMEILSLFTNCGYIRSRF